MPRTRTRARTQNTFKALSMVHSSTHLRPQRLQSVARMPNSHGTSSTASDEGLADDVCVGEVSVPVASLVSDESHGGPQRERKQWFSLQITAPTHKPRAVASSVKHGGGTTGHGDDGGGDGSTGSGTAAGGADGGDGSADGGTGTAAANGEKGSESEEGGVLSFLESLIAEDEATGSHLPAGASSDTSASTSSPKNGSAANFGDDGGNGGREGGGGSGGGPRRSTAVAIAGAGAGLELRLQLVLRDPSLPVTEDDVEASKAGTSEVRLG